MIALPAIEKKTLTDLVEERILETISAMNLGIGDCLPGEMEFAESLNVSRNIVREAFSRLRMLGILESRKKRGVILREADVTVGLRRVLSLPLFSESTERELHELRLIMELGICDFIIARKTDHDLAELEKIVLREEKYSHNRKISLECDVAFHSSLYGIVNNGTLNSFQSLLVSFFNSKTEEHFNPDRFSNPKEISHRDLLECLKRSDAQSFSSMVREHLNVHIKEYSDLMS